MQNGRSQVHAAAHQKATRMVYHGKTLVLLDGMQAFSGNEVVEGGMEGVLCALVGKVHLGIYHGGEGEICHHHEVYRDDVE